jgi:RNA polymerase sigma-70 factor (ECF subfamily)
MVGNDESEERDVSLAAAERLQTGDLIDIQRIQEVSHDAVGSSIDLGALFREHYKPIFRIAYRMTGSPSDAEDVLQTIFLRLTTREKFSLEPSPRAYLYRAAINASLDLLRQRKRSNSLPLDGIDLDRAPIFSGGSPEDELVDVELRELLRQAVAKLEGRAATAFVLRYYEGYDNSRIAEILGTSQMVVAVTLHRARTRLRKEIGSYLEKHNEAQ